MHAIYTYKFEIHFRAFNFIYNKMIRIFVLNSNYVNQYIQIFRNFMYKFEGEVEKNQLESYSHSKPGSQIFFFNYKYGLSCFKKNKGFPSQLSSKM